MEDTEHEVPEITAANRDGGAARLDADPISEDLSQSLDDLLDQAVRETSPEEQPITNTTDEATNTDPDGLSQETPQLPVESPVEYPSEPSSSEASNQQSEGVRQPQIEIDPEIAAIEQPRNLSEKNQSNWKKLQETASLYKKQADEAEFLRQRLAEAEQRPAQTPEDYEELKKFRDIFDIKNSPDFKSKYADPINSAKENIYGIMRKHGATDDVIQSIEKAGGPDKIDDKWWQENALAKLPLTDAKRLERSLVDVVELKEKQDVEIAHAAEHAEEILAQRQNQSQEWYQQENTGIRNTIEEMTKEVPWARYQQVPQNATDEQIGKIMAHNNAVASLEEKFNSALWPQNASQRASVAAAAVLSHVLTSQLRTEQASRATMEAQLKKLEAENSQLKGASRIPRQGVNTQQANKSTDLNSRIKMSASDAIDLGLDEAGS
jgi:hypothetical protein